MNRTRCGLVCITNELVRMPAPKKRTRRGTRGGRSRKRKPAPANGDGAGAAAEPDESVPAVESDGEAPEPAVLEPAEAPGAGGYVPMSEWIDDFDRRR